MRRWVAFTQRHEDHQFFTGGDRLYCSKACAAARGVSSTLRVPPPSSDEARDAMCCDYCGRTLFRPRGRTEAVMIGVKAFDAELMSLSRPAGRCRVRFSPRQATEIGGARFADQLPNGAYLLDTTKAGFISGPDIHFVSLADQEDPDEDCLDPGYVVEQENELL